MIPYNYLLLHTIEYDLLNEMPAVTLEVRDVMNKTFTGTLIQKIKAQNFFNKLADTPLLQKQGYNYKVNLKSSVPKREAVKERVRFDAELLKQMMMDVPAVKDDSIESPVIEIDLHIEKLAGDHARLNPGDILNIQVRAFQQALERAIVHRADRLYAIHGIGTGKLKNEIHRLLKTYKEIRSFNNDYHPRYGYGATEIILR